MNKDEAKAYFNKAIKPCSEVFCSLSDWSKYNRMVMLTEYEIDSKMGIGGHIAGRQSTDSIEISPNSDSKLLTWLYENNLILASKDFSFNESVNKKIDQTDFNIINGELFYLIKPKETKVQLKLSLSKSWIFAGFLTDLSSEQFDVSSVKGIVLGIHNLDSYLAIC